MEEIKEVIEPDVIVTGVGGGGLLSGILLHANGGPAIGNTKCTIIGVEPDTCPSMKAAMAAGKPVNIASTSEFVDGATIGEIGKYPYDICSAYLEHLLETSVPRVCREIIDLYHDGIIVEPAGALPFAVLDHLGNLNHLGDLAGKNVVCVLSGGNNDMTRYGDIIGQANLVTTGNS